VEQESELQLVQIRWAEVLTVVAVLLDIIPQLHLKESAELKFINHIHLSQMVLVVQDLLQVRITHHRFHQPEAMLKPTILRITTI
jgi:hypothetical protein